MIGCCFGTDEAPPNQQVIYMNEALANDFQAAFAEGILAFARDTESNLAPKECWPSTYEFRNILFKAGEHMDIAAAKYLDCIPDSDLRLFAQIELCAALAGLPQFGGTVIYPARASGRPAIRGDVGAPETCGARHRRYRCRRPVRPLPEVPLGSGRRTPLDVPLRPSMEYLRHRRHLPGLPVSMARDHVPEVRKMVGALRVVRPQELKVRRGAGKIFCSAVGSVML